MVSACLVACMDPIARHDWLPRQQSLSRKTRLKICSPSAGAAWLLGDMHGGLSGDDGCRQSCSWTTSSKWPRDPIAVRMDLVPSSGKSVYAGAIWDIFYISIFQRAIEWSFVFVLFFFLCRWRMEYRWNDASSTCVTVSWFANRTARSYEKRNTYLISYLYLERTELISDHSTE